MEHDLKRNKERLGNNAQGEIKDNIATDAALADARETASRKNVLNKESQNEKEGDIMLKIPQECRKISQKSRNVASKGGGAVAANILFLNLHKKVKYYGVIKVRK